MNKRLKSFEDPLILRESMLDLSAPFDRAIQVHVRIIDIIKTINTGSRNAKNVYESSLYDT